MGVIVGFGNQFIALPDKFGGFAVDGFTSSAVKQVIGLIIMSKARFKLKSGFCKELSPQPTKHFYIVSYTPQDTKPNPRLQLTINGRWLKAFGFTTGQLVTIDAQQKLLIIKIERRNYK